MPLPKTEISNPPILKKVIAFFSSSIARQGFLAGTDQAIISVSNFIATIILARNVSATELGVYAVGFTTIRLVRAIQDGISIQPLNTFGVAMDSDSFRKYVTSTGIIQIFLSLFSAVIAAIICWIFIKNGDYNIFSATFALWFSFFFWLLQEFIRRVFYVTNSVFSAVLISTINNIARFGFMFWLLSKGQLNGITGMEAIGIGSLISLIYGGIQTRHLWSSKYANLINTWKQNWDFGRWIAGGLISNWIVSEFYPILTAGIVSLAAAGAYRALQNLIAPVHVLLRAADTYLTPQAATIFNKKGTKALLKFQKLTYALLGIPILAMIGIAILIPEQLLQILYAGKYTEFASGIYFLALFYLFLYLYWPLQISFKAVQISRPIFLANFIAIFVAFTIGIWIIYKWGVYGTVAGQALNAFIIFVVLQIIWNKTSRNFSEKTES